MQRRFRRAPAPSENRRAAVEITFRRWFGATERTGWAPSAPARPGWWSPPRACLDCSADDFKGSTSPPKLGCHVLHPPFCSRPPGLGPPLTVDDENFKKRHHDVDGQRKENGTRCVPVIFEGHVGGWGEEKTRSVKCSA